MSESAQPDQSYRIRLLFTSAPDRQLKFAKEQERFALLDKECEISSGGSHYTLTIRKFDSEEAASKFLQQACSALIWIGLNTQFGFRFTVPSPPDLFESPQPIAPNSSLATLAKRRGWTAWDGSYEGDQTLVIPEHKRLFEFTTFPVQALMEMSLKDFVEKLAAGMSIGRPEHVFVDSKLRLACELYLSSHYEATPTASFLSRVTTIEALLLDVPAVSEIRTKIDKYVEDLRAEARSHKKDGKLTREFESAISGLERLRVKSIKSRIRTLAEETLQSDRDVPSPSAVAKELSDIYDLRSDLLHNGNADSLLIGKANGRLVDIVPRILRVLYRRSANQA